MVRVVVSGALVAPATTFPKEKLVGTKVTATTPKPFRLTLCVPVPALSEIVSVPLIFPSVVGENVTVMTHFPFGAKGEAQLFVSPKEAVAAMPPMFSEAVPEFVRVTGRVGLVPTTWFPKLMAVVESVTDCPLATGRIVAKITRPKSLGKKC